MNLQQRDISKKGYQLSSFISSPIATPTVLLESTLYNDTIGRYSILGAYPFLSLEGKENSCIITRYTTEGKVKETSVEFGDPLLILQNFYSKYNIIKDESLPVYGGALGFFSYELLYFNDVIGDIGKIPDAGPDTPLFWFAFYDVVCIEDKLTGKIILVGSDLGCEDCNESYYIKNKFDLIESSLLCSEAGPTYDVKIPQSNSSVSEIDKSAYTNKINKILSHIKDGDIFQACFTYTKSLPFVGKGEDLYFLLRKSNPAPFSAYIRNHALEVICCSPERFLKISPDNIIETRPIKGTRPRGKNPEEDLQLKKELRESIKDQAENIMITDLLRNDLGRVCELGSVKVKELFRIEEYANVFQLVSIIEGVGKSSDDCDRINHIKSLFPGGSMTGAPKRRALEILRTLETGKRGVYSGSIGYLGFNNSIDLNIVIRSVLLKDGQAFVGTGGGIVADSNPESEYKETNFKVRNIVFAISYINQLQNDSILYTQ